VIIYYQGIPPRTGFGSFAVANHTGVPIIWTLSEPYGSRDWWPCRNGLDDKADSIDVILRTPERFFGTTNGVQTGELVGGGKRTTLWKHQYPIATYLVAIAATNYEVQQDTIQLNGKILPLQQYVYPEASAAWKASVNSTRRMMRLFEQMFGPYPFRNERYAHTQVGFGGGMEHQTNSWMGNTSDQLIAHELAHQWFGNRVTCGSWQDIWLNEGFAVLLTYLNYETVLPRQQMVDWYTSEISIITYLPDGKVYVEDTTSVDRLFDYRLTYIKAAWVLQMLRWKLGDQKFSEASRNYLADTDLSYGFARTEDLKRVFEESSGMDLDGFFADWVYGEGHPSYQLQWKPIGAKVQYTLGQTTSHPSVDFFEMPVPILFRGQGRDTLVVIDHQVNGQSGLLDLGFTPDNAIIDPYVKLVSADNTVNRSGSGSITNSIKVYPNPIGDQFSILLENFNITSADLMVYNAAGQLVLRRTLSLPGGSDLVTIPSAGWARGVYIIRISNAEVNFTKRIIK
jgi:aminopeptidase N